MHLELRKLGVSLWGTSAYNEMHKSRQSINTHFSYTQENTEAVEAEDRHTYCPRGNKSAK